MQQTLKTLLITSSLNQAADCDSADVDHGIDMFFQQKRLCIVDGVKWFPGSLHTDVGFHKVDAVINGCQHQENRFYDALNRERFIPVPCIIIALCCSDKDADFFSVGFCQLRYIICHTAF